MSQRCERRRGEFRLEPLEFVAGPGEGEGELVEARVVSDQHHRRDRVRNEANARKQLVGGGSVQPFLDHHRRRADRRLHQLERFACAHRRGAKDELQVAAESAQVLGD
jgi:hypothetical protein